MKYRKLLAVGVAGTVLASTAACSSSNSGGGSTSASGAGQTLTVWLMSGSAPDALVTSLDSEFSAAHGGMKVDYQVQQWNGIQDKLTTALAGNNPPDVIELGNTQAPKFSASDALADLTGKKADLNGDHWLDGLAKTGVWNGKTYAAPFYGANRIVAYRTDMFAAAGVTPPTSMQEMLAAGKKLQQKYAADKQFQALYLPGQSWYSLLSFIWDEGGQVATESGGKWSGAVDSVQAQAGVRDYQTYYSQLSKGPADADEATPQQNEVFAKGHTAMAIMVPWEIGSATTANKALTGKIAAFPIPSNTGKKSAPVFLGGSNLAVAAGSKHQAEATDWLKLMLTDKYQKQLASNGVVPATTNLGSDVYAGNATAKVMAGAAQAGGDVTPATPNWAAVEAGSNPLKDMLTAVLTNKMSIAEATKAASGSLTKTLQSSS